MTPKKHTGRPTFGQMVEKVGTPRLGNDSQYLDPGLSKRQILFSKILLPSLDSKRWQFLPSTHTHTHGAARPAEYLQQFVVHLNILTKKNKNHFTESDAEFHRTQKSPSPKKPYWTHTSSNGKELSILSQGQLLFWTELFSNTAFESSMFLDTLPYS